MPTTPEQRARNATYMRGWNRRHRDRLRAVARAKRAGIRAAALREKEAAAAAAAILGEEWRPVADFARCYEVSNLGRIRSMRAANTSWRGKILRASASHKFGYRMVTLREHPRRHTYAVHTLVALAFLGAPPAAKHEVNHRDSNPGNNRVDNLEWVTRGENSRHAYRTNGRRAPKQKLTLDQACAIRNSSRQVTGVQLAREYGVSPSTISLIRRNKIFVHQSPVKN